MVFWRVIEQEKKITWHKVVLIPRSWISPKNFPNIGNKKPGAETFRIKPEIVLNMWIINSGFLWTPKYLFSKKGINRRINESACSGVTFGNAHNSESIWNLFEVMSCVNTRCFPWIPFCPNPAKMECLRAASTWSRFGESQSTTLALLKKVLWISTRKKNTRVVTCPKYRNKVKFGEQKFKKRKK